MWSCREDNSLVIIPGNVAVSPQCAPGELCATRKGSRIGKLCDCFLPRTCNTLLHRCLWSPESFICVWCEASTRSFRSNSECFPMTGPQHKVMGWPVPLIWRVCRFCCQHVDASYLCRCVLNISGIIPKEVSCCISHVQIVILLHQLYMWSQYVVPLF